MKADVIYLYPEQIGDDILVGGRSVFSVADLDELCDLLAHAATIKGWIDLKAGYNRYREKVCDRTFAIDGKLAGGVSHKELAGRIEKLGGIVSGAVSDDVDYLICNDQNSPSRKATKARQLGVPILSDIAFDFGAFGEDADDEDEVIEEGATVSLADVAPITLLNFKSTCTGIGITLENLKKITLRNNKFGTGDSAMFIFCDNDKFLAYKNQYRNAPTEQKTQIAEDFLAYVRTEPELEVSDNEGELPGTMPCVWARSDGELEETMGAYLEGNDRGHWIGTYAMEFTVDMAARTLSSREVIFYGDI